MDSKRISYCRIHLLLFLCLGSACIIAGCSSESAPNQEQTTSSPAEITLIQPDILAQYLPDAPEGWTLLQPTEQGIMLYEQSEYAAVSGIYKKDTSQVTIHIFDSAPFMSDQYKKQPSNEEINGYSVKTKELDPGPNGMKIYYGFVNVNDRINIEITGYGGTETDVKSFLSRIDYDGLSKLS